MLSQQEVIQRVRNVIRRKHMAWSTEQTYCHWIGRYYRFTETLPRHLPPEKKIEQFLSMLAKSREVSASTQNQAFNAILFLYLQVAGRKLGDISALRAKRHNYARHCPSQAEVIALLRHIQHDQLRPFRLVCGLLYGCGLRVNEALELRLKDVRLDDRHLVIRGTKGGRDRWVKIPDLLDAAIRRQVNVARATFEEDQRRPTPLPLQIPHGLARKYPQSPFTIGWEFLFPAVQPMPEPRTQRIVRWHLPDWSVQRACKLASIKAGLIAAVTPHCLRHGFATHFQGDIRDLQELLGHKSLETTQIYRHPQLERTRSPIDDLFGKTIQFPLPAAAPTYALRG